MTTTLVCAMVAAHRRTIGYQEPSRDLAARSTPGVAMIRVPGRPDAATAIVFRQSGGRVYAVTAAHVLGGTSEIEALLPGTSRWILGRVEGGTVQAQQGELGLGVVSFPYAGEGIPMLMLRSDAESGIKAGERVRMVGYPGPNRPWEVIETTIDNVNDEGMIGLKQSRSPGFSGGPLLIGERLIGVILAGNPKTRVCRLTTVIAYLEGTGLLPKLVGPPPQQIDVPEAVSPLPGVSLRTRLGVERDSGDRPFSSVALCQPGDTVNLKLSLSNQGPETWRNPQIHLLLDPRFAYTPDTSRLFLKKDNKNYQSRFPENFLKKREGEIVWGIDDMGVKASDGVFVLFSVRINDADRFPVGQSEVPFRVQVTSASGGVAVVEPAHVIVDRNQSRVARVSARLEVTDDTLKPNVWYDRRAACANPGDDISYRLILQNVGTVDATKVRVRLHFDGGVECLGNALVSSEGRRTQIEPVPVPDGGKGAYDLLVPRVGAGTGGTIITLIHAKLRKDAPLGQELRVTAETSDSGQPCWENAVRVLVVPERNTLDLRAASPGTVAPGDIVRVELSLINGSRKMVANQSLHVDLPEDLELVAGSLQSDGGIASGVEYAIFDRGLIPTDAQPGFVQDWTFYVRVRPWSRQIGKMTTIKARLSDPGGGDSAFLPIVIREHSD